MYNSRGLAALLLSAWLLSGGVALARCPGGSAAPGAVIHGPVLAIPDASSLCLALGAAASSWIEVKLAQPSPSYPLLMAAAFGKDASCVIDGHGAALCDIEGRPLAVDLQSPATMEASAAWRCEVTANTGTCLDRTQPSEMIASLPPLGKAHLPPTE
jgi:hypothetical protein